MTLFKILHLALNTPFISLPFSETVWKFSFMGVFMRYDKKIQWVPLLSAIQQKGRYIQILGYILIHLIDHATCQHATSGSYPKSNNYERETFLIYSGHEGNHESTTNNTNNLSSIYSCFRLNQAFHTFYLIESILDNFCGRDYYSHFIDSENQKYSNMPIHYFQILINNSIQVGAN